MEQSSGNDQMEISCTAFDGTRLIASGTLPEVAGKVKITMDTCAESAILVFDDCTGKVVEIDLRGTVEEVLKRVEKSPGSGGPGEEAQASQKGPGRPRLGVVPREVTLLPRHWEWLANQPGGASVALRKLVDEARRANAGKDRVRLAREAAFKFMSAMAGNLPGFEEAARALFAGEREKFGNLVSPWPPGIRDYSMKLSSDGFSEI